jgi:Zn-dependent peptidase ImmA (M78 family)
VRKLWNVPRGAIASVTALLESAGVLVVPSNFGTKGFSGVSTVTNAGVFIIFINKTMPGDRQRFTLAHELGHIVMHRTIFSETMERDADRFASEFLMPATDIRSQLTHIKLDRLAALKLHWKVSMGALLMRAYALEVITERQYRYLWMQMGQHGYRVNEPIEYAIQFEQPTLLKDTIRLHLDELQYLARQLAEGLLALYEDEMNSVYEISKKRGETRLRLINGRKK